MAAAKQPQPRRHHYVPQFYLERFADPQGKLGAFDRQAGKVITTSAKNVAVERDFNRLPDDSNLPPMMLDDLYTSQEPEAAVAIRETVSGGRVDPSKRETLALHLVLQERRTRAQRNTLRAMSEFVFSAQAQVGLTERLTQNSFATPEERQQAEQTLQGLADGELVVAPDEQALAGMVLSGLEEAVNSLLSGWKWIVVLLPRPMLITSDSPICMLGEPEPGSPATGVGWETALEIWFPLDPRHALVLTRDHSLVSPLIGLASDMRARNHRLALQSERWSFFLPGSKALEGLAIPREPPKFIEDVIGTRQNNDGTQGELVRLGVEPLQVPNERLLSGHALRHLRGKRC